MLLLQGAYIGTQPAVFAELFPTATRYSGASVSLTLGTIFGGAPAPFIATALFNAPVDLDMGHGIRGRARSRLMAVRARVEGDIPPESQVQS
jgi:hypothetical protein